MVFSTFALARWAEFKKYILFNRNDGSQFMKMLDGTDNWTD